MKLLAATLLLLACACRGVPPAAAPAAEPRAPAQPAAPRASGRPVELAPANRDAHGPSDVDGYVRSLLAPERIARFQVPLVLDRLDPEPDALIGDLGCGPGIFSTAFARRCPRGLVYAADVEPRQLDALNTRLAEEDIRNVVPVLASLADPHFPPGALDLVFVADTYHHLEDRVAYMRRLAGALKPGGRVALLDYKPGKLDHGPPPEHKLPAGTMEREMREAGYVLVQSFDTHADHDFQVWRPMTPWELERR